jgi:hypothetical protein
MKVPISSTFLDALAFARRMPITDADDRDGDGAASGAPCASVRAQPRAAGRVTLDSLIFLLCCSNRVAVPCDSRGHKFESPSITVRRTAWRKEQRRRSQSLRPRRRLRRSRLPSAKRPLARNNATALRSICLRSLRELRRSTGGIRGSQTAPPMTPKEFDGRRRRRDRGKHSWRRADRRAQLRQCNVWRSPASLPAFAEMRVCRSGFSPTPSLHERHEGRPFRQALMNLR